MFHQVSDCLKMAPHLGSARGWLPGNRKPPAPVSLVFVPAKKAGSGSDPYGTAGRETGKSHHTSPILKGQVREPPDIAQPHCITHHGEDEIQLARPVPSGFIFIPHIVFLKGGKKRRVGRERDGKPATLANKHGGAAGFSVGRAALSCSPRRRCQASPLSKKTTRKRDLNHGPPQSARGGSPGS